MKKRRSRISIIADILTFLEKEGGEASTTRIATATGLAYDRMIKILEELERRGIIKLIADEKSKKAIMTERGFHLLIRLRELRRLLEDLGLEIF
ncbi:MAG: winged helix-turn-helix domain-containing protein [Sulfolobales archaeon]